MINPTTYLLKGVIFVKNDYQDSATQILRWKHAAKKNLKRGKSLFINTKVEKFKNPTMAGAILIFIKN